MKNRLFWRLTAISGCLCASFFIVTSVPAQTTPSGIKLLYGYKYEKRSTLGVLSATGIIYGVNGLLIELEEGMNTCCAADAANSARYAWFKEQTIRGHKVYVALIREGVKTEWEPDKPRSKEWGNLLLVSYPLGAQKSHGINFVAEILSDEELVDALLMILTFDPERP